MRRIATVLLVLAAWCFLPARAAAEDQGLRIGETTGYAGIFCRDAVAADLVLAQIQTSGENAPLVSGGCAAARGNVRLLRRLNSARAPDSPDTWTIVEVDAGAPTPMYIVTAMPVQVGLGI